MAGPVSFYLSCTDFHLLIIHNIQTKYIPEKWLIAYTHDLLPVNLYILDLINPQELS